MAKALSPHLRDRVVAAIDGGLICRVAAARFGVSVSSAIRWHQLARKHGRAVARKPSGEQRSSKTEVNASTSWRCWRSQATSRSPRSSPVLPIAASVSASGLCGGSSSVTGSRVKKTGHAIEQDRSDVLKHRRQGFNGQLDLEPERLVFIDETRTTTNMTCSDGRCLKDGRLRMGFPHGHRIHPV